MSNIEPPFGAGMLLMEKHVCSLPILKLPISPEYFTVNSINSFKTRTFWDPTLDAIASNSRNEYLWAPLNPQEEDFESWCTAWCSLLNEFWSGGLRRVSGCAFEQLLATRSFYGATGESSSFSCVMQTTSSKVFRSANIDDVQKIGINGQKTKRIRQTEMLPHFGLDILFSAM